MILFLAFAASVVSFLNIPQLRTFAPLAFARAIKSKIIAVKAELAAPFDSPTSGDAELDQIILQTGDRYGIDPRLIHYVVLQESRYRANAVSPKGACGLMQLTHATARRFACENPNNPRANLEAGTKYLRWLLERYDGDLERALAAYNAGEGTVDEYDGVPPYTETRGYVQHIIKNYGKRTHPVLSPEDARRAFNSTVEETATRADATSAQNILPADSSEQTSLR